MYSSPHFKHPHFAMHKLYTRFVDVYNALSIQNNVIILNTKRLKENLETLQ